MNRNLNYKEVFENIVQGVVDYISTNSIKSICLGISGGLDSTVCAAICHEVSKRTGAPLICVSLPCSTNARDENDSALLAMVEFATEYSMHNMQDTFKEVEKFCKQVSEQDSTPISQGNIKARLRMITLYDIASKRKGIVIDTDNKTEHHLGFFTIHGDCADLNPIGSLWKHEVYELAKWMRDNVYKGSNALQAAIDITPTDGNGVAEGGDLAQIAPGSTYEIVDDILCRYLNGETIADIQKNTKYDYNTIDIVVRRCRATEFKRRHAPLVVDITNAQIYDNSGKRVL